MQSSKRGATPEEKIRARAHEIWLEQGQPEGQHIAHWQQAEAEIAGKKTPPTGARGAGKTAAAKSTPAAAKPAAKPKAAPAAAKPAAKPRSKAAAK